MIQSLQELKNVPIGWINTSIGNISLQINSGFSSTENENIKNGIIQLRPYNITKEGKIDLSQLKYVKANAYDYLKKGDILFNSTNSAELVGKTSYIEEDTNYVYSSLLTRIRTDISIFNYKWITLCIQYLFHKGLYKINSRRSENRARISKEFLEKIQIPIPPLKEQHRIISKTTELFSKIYQGNIILKNLQIQLIHYHKSFLQQAFDGNLTERWRHNNRHKIQPASVLLEKILSKTRKKTKFKSSIPKPKNVKIPQEWEFILSHYLFSFITSGSRGWAKYYSENGSIFLRVNNLDYNSVDLNLKKIQRVVIPKQSEGKRTSIKHNDILVSITGSTVGKVAIIPEKYQNAYVSQHIALARPISEIHPKFLAWYLSSTAGGQKQIVQLNKGATKGGLTLNDIRNIWIPLPNYEEQKVITELVENTVPLIGKISESLYFNICRLENLRKSILKSAFEGKLVPQDPNDEPASILLEKIQKEKIKNGKKTKT